MSPAAAQHADSSCTASLAQPATPVDGFAPETSQRPQCLSTSQQVGSFPAPAVLSYCKYSMAWVCDMGYGVVVIVPAVLANACTSVHCIVTRRQQRPHSPGKPADKRNYHITTICFEAFAICNAAWRPAALSNARRVEPACMEPQLNASVALHGASLQRYHVICSLYAYLAVTLGIETLPR